MPTYSSAPASVAYEKAASQPLGALCTGMGYAPDTAITTTTTTQYIGGAAQSIGYAKGVQGVQEELHEAPHKGRSAK
jgi:hypothetical protein